MSHILADRLLALAGPGRMLHYGCQDDALVRALLQRGCDALGWTLDASQPDSTLGGRISGGGEGDDKAFDVVIVPLGVAATAQDLQGLLGTLRQLVSRTLVLDCSISLRPVTAADESVKPHTNQALEAAAIAAGYRRHPAAFPAARYWRLNDPTPEPLLCFEKIPDTVLGRWPEDYLLANRDLHMDMTREASPRSDAHLVRYALAAELIRPGDTVLDCACGLGYGSALLAASSRGGRFIAVDIDEESVAYARDNFAGYPVEYHAASAIKLDFLPNHSVDLVVTFETIEHLPDYEQFLDEIARVLKPDGRVIGSVPHLWVDATGRDPNPHHFHAFDYSRIRDAFARRFIVEARYGQTAPGGVKLGNAPRHIEQRPLLVAAEEADTEWWILVAAANPSLATDATYTHPEFDPCTRGTQSQLTAFAKHYDNPWIYRQLIQIGQRIRDPDVLAATVEPVMAQARKSSADHGAMLTVLAYKALQDHDDAAAARLSGAIEDYLAVTTENPHVHRWQISLAYVAALLSLDAGKRDRGQAFLGMVLDRDPLRFSALLSTKVISAHFLLGTMALVDGRTDSARTAFAAGVATARKALHSTDENAIGRPDHPLAFGFFELAEIADMAGQCAMALNEIDAFGHTPGRFWRNVDSKRFGLFTWIRNVEIGHGREHARLQTEIGTLQAEIETLRANLDAARASCTLRALLPQRLREVFLLLVPSMTRRAWESLVATVIGFVRPRR